MKKSLLKSLALAVVGSFCVVAAASASMITGGISMSGPFLPTIATGDATMENATGINFVDNTFNVVTASGSFDGLEYSSGTIADFQFDSYTNSGAPFWTVGSELVFSFEMDSLTFEKGAINNSDYIQVYGLGTMRASGYDDTPGVWNFTGQGVNNANLSWSASTGTNPVPEPATMLLFGTGLIGLATISRRRNKRIQEM